MKKVDLSLLPEALVKRLSERGINVFEEIPNGKLLEDGSEILNKISDQCPFEQCDGSGQLWLKKTDGSEVVRYCDCAVNLKIQRLIKSAKVPLDFQKVTINSFDINIYKQDYDKKLAAVAKRALINYVNNFESLKSEGKGIYLYSETKGSGKTRLAISILNALIKKYKVEGFYITSKNLFDELRASFDIGNTQEVLNKFLSIPVLILDDLGVEKFSEWTESTFTQILDSRMNQKLVTIITSNLTQEALDSIYVGGRVASRVKKMTVPIQMPSEDVRANLAKKENERAIKVLLKV